MSLQGADLSSIAYVDLASLTVSYRDLGEYARFLGGRGVAGKILFDMSDPTSRSLDPRSVLIISTGELSGTSASCMSRTCICGKNALNGGFASANVGGSLAPRMKWAGIDHLVMTGDAASPVWLELADGKVSFHDATPLWGMTTSQTYSTLRASRGRDVAVACIGPAGEAQCFSASILVDGGNCAAWGGLGAVMGSKKVKAVVARAKPTHIYVGNALALGKKAAELNRRMAHNAAANRLGKYGSLGNAGILPFQGNTPQSVRNAQDEYWPCEKGLNLRQVVFEERFHPRTTTCTSCPIRCNRIYRMSEPLLGMDLALKGVQANAVRGFGPNLDQTDPWIVLRANALCNELGMNIDEAAASLAWATECSEQGILSLSDTGGMRLQWGASEHIPVLLRDMGFKQGFGALMSDGLWRAFMQVGRGSGRFAVQVKQTGINEQGLRSFKGWALGIMTSSRGGGHLNGAVSLERRVVKPETVQRIWGIEPPRPDQYEGKGRLVAWFERFKAVVDSLGLCYFATVWSDPDLIGPDDLVDLIRLEIGLDFDVGEVMALGETIVNVEKAFNTLHAGFKREDDLPPQRLFDLAVSGGPFAGAKLDPASWDRALTDYYEAHGWDASSGLQIPEKLAEAGLSDIARHLVKAKK